MNFEEVKREVVRLHRYSFIEISFPSFKRLTGQAGDQVETDIVKTGVAKHLECRPCIC